MTKFKKLNLSVLPPRGGETGVRSFELLLFYPQNVKNPRLHSEEYVKQGCNIFLFALDAARKDWYR